MGLFFKAPRIGRTHLHVDGNIWQLHLGRQSLGHDLLDSERLGVGLASLSHEWDAHRHLCWWFVFYHLGLWFIGSKCYH